MDQHEHFHWNALMTNTIVDASTFYAATIGCPFNAIPLNEGTDRIAMNSKAPVAGICELSRQTQRGTPPHWFVSLAFDKVDERVGCITDKGDSVGPEPSNYSRTGRAVIVDGQQRRTCGLEHTSATELILPLTQAHRSPP